MSINIGYWPRGSLPAMGTCVPTKEHANAIKLPGRFQGVGSVSYCVDDALGYDSFARAALETLRNTYHNLPTAGVKELGAFFCEKNFNYLFEEIKRRTGLTIDKNDLFDVMLNAYAMILPRSDPTDFQERTCFDDRVTQRYVAEMNRYVFDNTLEDVKQADKLWDFWAKNVNGPSEFPEHLDTDTRSRLVGSLYAFDYDLPDD